MAGAGYASAGRNEGAEADHMSEATSTNRTSVRPGPEYRLAVYGSLAPGRANHDQMDGLSGHWTEGSVRGRLLEEGWGAEIGYPGIILDTDGPSVGVQLFESLDLRDHWARLDEFEGTGYRRTVTTVSTVEGDLPAFIYVLAADSR
jgi:gamma-glutamylcyclotransferase (GGCT)/AIG2-like uncharacterized protein YtfP